MHATHTKSVLCSCTSFLSMSVSVGSGVSQTCIGNDDGELLSAESLAGFFVSVASPATCSGTLTQWRYCYYTGQTQPGATARLGLYTNTKEDDYELVSGSVTLVTVSSVPSSPSFVCGAVAPPQNVTVMPGDIIGTCLPENNTIALLSNVSQEMLQQVTFTATGHSCDTLSVTSATKVGRPPRWSCVCRYR